MGLFRKFFCQVVTKIISIYWSNKNRWEIRTIVKYANDSVIVSRLQDNTSNGPVIGDFVKWCKWVWGVSHHLFQAYFHIDKTMLTLFYCTFIKSILYFSLVSWFGNLSLKNRNSLNQMFNPASRTLDSYSRSLAQFQWRLPPFAWCISAFQLLPWCRSKWHITELKPVVTTKKDTHE